MAQTVGQQSSGQPPIQTLQMYVDASLSEVRILRDAVVKAHAKINAAASGENEVTDAYWKNLVDRLTQANKYYESLENHARSLPPTSTSYPQMERLMRFLNEVHLYPHIKELYEKGLETSTWVETSAQFLHYYTAFFRRFVTSQRRSLVVERPLTFSHHTPNTSPQFIFYQLLPQAVTEFSNNSGSKKLFLSYRFLERSTLSAIIELKYGRYTEKLFGCHQKMLIVVNNGNIESLLIIAPHEDWTYLDEGRKKVDILKESRYAVYQKLTVQAHIHLMQTIHSFIDNQALTMRSLVNALTLLGRFHETINFKCKVRTMKNCLPPTIFDILRTNAMQALHESCR